MISRWKPSNLRHSNKEYRKKRVGFTLAEVLITLLIIGVVASIILPNLINDTQDSELKVAWKKMYADINQATKLLIIDNGGTLKGLFNAHDGMTTNEDMQNRYIVNLSYTKKCAQNAGIGICWHKNDGSSKNLDKTPITTWSNNPASVILNNGGFIRFTVDDSDCNYNVGTPVVFTKCATVETDINGFKGPNTVGKDIFAMHITETIVKSYGTQGDGSYNSCNSSASGWGCSAKFLYQ